MVPPFECFYLLVTPFGCEFYLLVTRFERPVLREISLVLFLGYKRIHMKISFVIQWSVGLNAPYINFCFPVQSSLKNLWLFTPFLRFVIFNFRALKLLKFACFRAIKISKYESDRALRVTLFEINRALKISKNSIKWFIFNLYFIEKIEIFSGEIRILGP